MDDTTDVRRVRSAGLDLAVRERSTWAPGKRSVVLVHGYPDQQDVWEPVAACLPAELYHVVTYDVRGAGASGVPANRAGYRTERLVEDLAAVVAATVPDDQPIHLVGHDWGSVQVWDAVNAERGHDPLAGRIASFTSISGPSLDHVARVAGQAQRRPVEMLRQLRASWYVYAFQVPVLPELVWRSRHHRIARLLSEKDGADLTHWGPELGRNAANGVNLYRANLLPRQVRPRLLRTDVPVLVVHPTRDRFVTEVFLTGLEQACTDLRLVTIDAGHWVIRSHPERVAELVREHVDAHG